MDYSAQISQKRHPKFIKIFPKKVMAFTKTIFYIGTKIIFMITFLSLRILAHEGDI